MTVYAGRYGPDNFVDPYGNPVKNTPFEVRQGGVLSTLYIDRDRTSTAANPGMSDALGNITFYAEPGFYDVTVGQTTLSLVVVPDPAEPGGGGGGAVDSVNAQTGVVVLGYSDVGAASAAQGATADSAVQPGDLAAVATTGDYDDLTGTPTIPSTPSEVGADPAGTAAALVDDLSGVSNQAAARTALGLGTAAVTAATDYASATQGGKADTAVQPGDLGTAASEDVGVPNGVATLDGGGKVPTGQLPALAVTDVFPVASQAAMLALAAERGDVAIRSDTNTSWILSAEPASTLSNWLQLATPPDAVLSVNGQAGVVSLAASDVGAATAAQGTTADSAVQPGDLAPVATSGAYPDLTGKPTIPSTAQDVDAVPVTSIGLLPGERNRGYWDNATTYAVGDVVYDYNGDGQVYVAIAPSTGEQPSLGLGSWTLVASAGRDIAIGPAAAASDTGVAIGMAGEAPGIRGVSIGMYSRTGSDDLATNVGSGGYAIGTNSTNVGAFGQAAGAGATNVGVNGSAGTGATNVGSESSASGDGAVALGHNQHADGNGDVAIAGLIVGHVTDPLGTPVPDGLTLTPGFADLPETTDATDPATDHQRIVARTDGIYVRDDTGTEVGPLISSGYADAAVAASSQVGTLAARPSATGLPDGTTYFASDDNGGTIYVASSDTWIAAAPTETLPATIIDAAGDLIVGSGSDAATRLAVGTAGQVLGSDGTTVKWQAGGVVRATRTGAHYGPVGSSAGTDNSLMAAVDRWWGVVMYLPAGTYDQMQLATSVAGTSTMAVGVYPCSSNGYPATGAAVLAAGGDVNLSAAAGVLTSAISLTLAVPTVVAVMGSITAYTSAATFRTIAAYGDPGVSNGQLGLPVQPLSTSTGGGVLAGVQGLASGSTAGVSTFPSGLSLGYSVPKFRMRAA